MKKISIENRIALLTTRNKENNNIVKKLQRQLRALENNNTK